MKRPLSRSMLARLASFTLIELLVAMVIIAILVAVLLPAVGLAINSAKRAKAANTATQIQTGVLNYYTEYSVYPVPSTTSGDYILTDTSTSASGWGNLICILCGNIQPSSPTTAFTPTSITNSRGIAFLSLKSTDVDANNAPVNPLQTSTNLYFNIAIDSDYDGLLGTAGNTSGKLPNFTLSTSTTMNFTGSSTAGVAVWENCSGVAGKNNPAWYVHTY